MPDAAASPAAPDAAEAGGEDRSTWPIFVVGCHRSGTTLVRFVLDTHPSIACPPESKFIAGLQRFSEYPQLRTSLHTMGVTYEDLMAELRGMTSSIMGGYAARRKKHRWADKTPNYYRLLPFLRDMYDGKALFLFVVRHPFDTVSSLVEYVDRGGGASIDPDFTRITEGHGGGPHAWAKYWTEVYESIDVFRAQFPDLCHVLRYEDLVRRPEPTLADTFGFLAEDFDPKLVGRIFLSHHDHGLEDYKIRMTARIHDRSIGTWTGWPEPMRAAVWREVGPMAELLGYSADSTEPATTEPADGAAGPATANGIPVTAGAARD